MYNASFDEIQELEEGSMYFVEHSMSYGPSFLNGVYGKVILFDQDKYCAYEYRGIGVGKSQFGIEGMFAQGIVRNVYDPEDFEGIFINGTADTAFSGVSGSIGYDFNDKRPVISNTQGAVAAVAFSLGGSIQYFNRISNGWVYDVAPIDWQERPGTYSGEFAYYALNDGSGVS
jgi:hypothetical protein